MANIERSWQFPDQAAEYLAWAEKVIAEARCHEQAITDGYGVRWYDVNSQKQPAENHPPQNILILSPHPDDAEFAAAVTMYDHVQQGDHVSVLLCTCGSAGRERRGFTQETLPKVRLAEALASAGITNIWRVGVLITPDGNLGLSEWFWEGNEAPMRRLGIALLRQINPHVIYSPPPGDEYESHPDHGAAGSLAGWMAGWGTETDFYRASLPADQPVNLQEWRQFTVWPGKRNLPADLINAYPRGSQMEAMKQAALTCHHSQMGDLYALAALDRDGYWGTMMFVGQDLCPRAEVFAVSKPPAIRRVNN